MSAAPGRPKQARSRLAGQAEGRRVHMFSGARTLFYKEVLRFWKVGFQTVCAPVLTAIMYLLVFGHTLEDHVRVYDSVGYTQFLIPGLVMMLSLIHI